MSIFKEFLWAIAVGAIIAFILNFNYWKANSVFEKVTIEVLSDGRSWICHQYREEWKGPTRSHCVSWDSFHQMGVSRYEKGERNEVPLNSCPADGGN